QLDHDELFEETGLTASQVSAWLTQPHIQELLSKVRWFCSERAQILALYKLPETICTLVKAATFWSHDHDISNTRDFNTAIKNKLRAIDKLEKLARGQFPTAPRGPALRAGSAKAQTEPQPPPPH